MARMTHWHRFSIRQLLLLTALVAVAVFLIERNTRRDRAVNSLKLLGARVNNLDISHGWIACEGPTFGDQTLDTLILFPDLKGLSLAESQITDSGMAKLSRLKELQKLDLSDTRVSDAGLKQLQGLENLGELDVGKTAVGNDKRVVVGRRRRQNIGINAKILEDDRVE